MRKINIIIGVVILSAIILGGLYSFQNKEVIADNFIMDTFITIKLYDHDKEKAQVAVDEAWKIYHKIHNDSNRFTLKDYPKGSIKDLNLQAGIREVKVQPEIFKMLALSQTYHGLTQGAFDITIGPVMDLWGFGKEKQQIPKQEALNEKLALVNMGALQLNQEKSTALLRKQGMEIDLGGIAKGYATEQVVNMLKSKGLKKGIINAGGNIYVLGQKDNKSLWQIGVQDPRNSEEIVGILSVKDQYVVTSGDYQRYFIVGKQRYHHILDPKTGYPANDIMSVTVICKDGTQADILSTSLFVLGLKDGMKLLEKMPGVEAVFITHDRKVIATKGIKKAFKFTAGREYTYES
jgi:thiamine biosynthesis lipoprotein